tara:strand:- start:2005 stop:3969 length:1965 start_codon:yes stop_codon:yes gene_type:complete
MSDTKLKSSNIGDLAITHDKLHTTMDLTGKTVTIATPTADTHPATKVYVDTEVANLIDSAPGTLDTLNELAAAINDDANFNATIASSIATKLPLAGGTMTGVIAGFESTGIDDNATSTAITIDSSENVTLANGAILKVKDAFGDTAMQFNVLSSGSNSGRINVDPDNTGANSQLSIFIDNSEKVVVDSSGNVGIGTSSPSGLAKTLNIDGGSSGASVALDGGDNFVVMYTGATVGDPTSIFSNTGFKFATATSKAAAGFAERMRIDSSGNVGIGTSSPSCELTVSSGASSVPAHSYTQLEIESASHSAIQLSGSTGAEQWLWFADDTTATPVGGITYYHGGPYMGFRVESAERMRIDSSGNVGIGSSSPSEKLTIQSGNINFMGGTNDAQYIKFGDTGDDDIGSILYYHGNNNMVFTTNASEAMRIDSSGNVGIGTSSPSAKLHVDVTGDGGAKISASGQANLDLNITGTTDGCAIRFGDGGADNRGGIRYQHSEDSMRFYTNGNTERMRIDSAGIVTKPYQPAFCAIKNGQMTETSGDNVITGWTTKFDTGSDFNNSTNRFIAPVGGTYHFSLNVMVPLTSGDVQFRIFKNGVRWVGSNDTYDGGSYSQVCVTTAMPLSTNDYVEFVAYSNQTNSNIIVYTSDYSHITGHLIG